MPIDSAYFLINPTFSVGCKGYEVADHLGNIRAVVSDRREAVDSTNNSEADFYEGVVLAANDYYPFGQRMPGRTFQSGGYRYGFNGKEKDEEDEWGDLTHYDYGFRIYNPAVGRFLSVDLLMKSYPMLSPYQFSSNSPIAAVDLDGLEFSLSTTMDDEVYVNAHFKILNSSDLSDKNLKRLIEENLKPEYLKMMDRYYNDHQHKGWFTFEFVEKVNPGDYFIEIVEPNDEKLKIAEGRFLNGLVNEIGGNNIIFSTMGITNQQFEDELSLTNLIFNEGQEFGRSILHEIGHLLGLLHVWDQREVNEIGTFTQTRTMDQLWKSAKEDPISKSGNEIRENLMNSPANPEVLLQPANGQGNSLTNDQFGKMYENVYDRDKKNKDEK